MIITIIHFLQTIYGQIFLSFETKTFKGRSLHLTGRGLAKYNLKGND